MFNVNLKFLILKRLSFIGQCALLLVLSLCGCQGPQSLPVAVPKVQCPGKMTVIDAAAALAKQQTQLGPMRASTRCVMQWRDDKNKSRQEPVDGRVWFIPPDKVIFRGDKFGKEVSFGVNAAEFWLRVKPEMDTYWYGTRPQAHACAHVMPMNPADLAEAIGIVQIDTRWELFHRKGLDILTLSENGRLLKRVFIECCNYRIERVEYFDSAGHITAATDLSDYAMIGDGMTLPSKIRLTAYDSGKADSSVEFQLQQARRFEPTDRQMQLFQRPGRDGYGTVLRLNENCDFMPE